MREDVPYKPYLLNRLTDFDPQVRKETPDKTVAVNLLKKDVFDNLSMIFNSRSHLSLEELQEREELADSVLGYGLPDYCGKTHSLENQEYLRGEILKQLSLFEPRLDKAALEVEGKDKDPARPSIMTFAIRGPIVCGPIREEIRFTLKVDLETGINELS